MTTVETGAPDAPRTSHRRASENLVLRVVVLVVVLLPVAAVLVTRVGRPYFPLEDRASIDLWVRDVFTSHTPLVGAYSRGFNHPGPAYFYALAPLSKLFGGATWTTLVGAALVQGAGAVLLAWAAFRRAGTAFMLLMLGALGLAYIGLDELGQFTNAWNPYAAIPYFVLFLVLVWAVATGNRWSVVGALAVGTFVVQCHVGYTPLVAVMLVWAAVMVVLDRRAQPDTAPRWSMVLGASAATLFVLWLPPVIEEIRDRPGNLTAIWNYFTEGGGNIGLRAGAGLYGTEFRIIPPWLGGNETYGYGTHVASPSSAAWLVIPAVLLVVGWSAARRSGRRTDQRLVELAALGCVTGVVALSRLTIEPLPYTFYWRGLIATFTVAACGWAIAHALPNTWAPWPRRVGIAAALLAVAWGFGAQTVDVLEHTEHLSDTEAAAADVYAQVRAQGLPTRPVLIRALGVTFGGVDQGLIDALDHDGAPVRVDRQYGYHFGDQRTAAPSEVAEVWYVGEEGRYKTLLPELPGARVVATTTPLSRADERELRTLQREAIDALRAAGRDDLVDTVDNRLFELLMGEQFPNGVPGLSTVKVERIAELNRVVGASGSCRCVVVAFPADQDPKLPYTVG
ncbi:MAG TPA: hypothetical protein VGN51_20460 [Acidimicrobiia bacterium]